MVDYLNPNSLLERGAGIYGETGFGESVDQGILRQLQAENQMRQANAGTELTQALARGKLPNELAESNLSGARANLLLDPKYLQLYGDKFQGEADKAYSDGALARAGLPQKIANQQQTLGIENTKNAQLIKDIDNLVASGQVPPQVGQLAKLLSMNGGKAPNMSNPLSTFGAFQGLDGSSELRGNSMSSRIAQLIGQASPDFQNKVSNDVMSYNKGIAEKSIGEAGDIQKASISASASHKSDFIKTVQLVHNEAKMAEQAAKNKATELATRIKEFQNSLASLDKNHPDRKLILSQIDLARQERNLATKQAEAAANRVTQITNLAVSRLGLSKEQADQFMGTNQPAQSVEQQPAPQVRRYNPATGKLE